MKPATLLTFCSTAIFMAGVTVATEVAAADVPDTPAIYANRLVIDTAGKPESLYRLRLPLDVYRGLAHGDLRDVRVFNARGERVPYALTREPDRETVAIAKLALPFFPLMAESASTSTVSSSNVSLSVRMQPDGTLISVKTSPSTKTDTNLRIAGYVVDASELSKRGIPIEALEFEWARNDAAQSGMLRVEASNDLKDWRTVVSGAPLLDLQFNGEALRQKRVKLPQMPQIEANYLRLTWEKSAFSLKTLHAETVNKSTQRLRETVTATARAGEKPGEYFFDLGARVTATELRLLLPEQNSIAPVSLFAQSMQMQRQRGGNYVNVPAWQPVANAMFYRLLRDGVEITAPTVTVNAPAGTREWLARVDARSGGIGQGMPQLEVTWQPHHIVFAARGDAPYTLAFGRRDAISAELNVANLLPDYKPNTEFALPQATLRGVSAAAREASSENTQEKAKERAPETVQPSTQIVTPVAESPTLDRKKMLLWLVLVGGVAILLWMAWRLGRSEAVVQDENAGNNSADASKQ
jgi:Protein of unknown function (DUF3999)